MPLQQMSFRLKPSYFDGYGPVCTRSTEWQQWISRILGTTPKMWLRFSMWRTCQQKKQRKHQNTWFPLHTARRWLVNARISNAPSGVCRESEWFESEWVHTECRTCPRGGLYIGSQALKRNTPLIHHKPSKETQPWSNDSQSAWKKHTIRVLLPDWWDSDALCNQPGLKGCGRLALSCGSTSRTGTKS